MAELKTIRLKKLDNLKDFGEVEGRTYYVEENNTLYRDVLSTKMAVGQVYFAPDGITKLGKEKTLTLSNVLVISNEITNPGEKNSERAYKIGMYDENGKYIDLSYEFDSKGLLKSISDDSDINEGILNLEVL